MAAPTVSASLNVGVIDRSGGADADGTWYNPFEDPCAVTWITAPNAATCRLLNPDGTDPINIELVPVAGHTLYLPPKCGLYFAGDTSGAKWSYQRLGQQNA